MAMNDKTPDAKTLYKRPRGRPPNGIDWDQKAGEWVPKEFLVDVSQATEPAETAAASMKTVAAMTSPRLPPRKNSDGTFVRPRGQGTEWDDLGRCKRCMGAAVLEHRSTTINVANKTIEPSCCAYHLVLAKRCEGLVPTTKGTCSKRDELEPQEG